MADGGKFEKVEQYLKKNKMQVRVSIYYSGMSGYIANLHSTLPGMELLADARGDTLEECLGNIGRSCEHLLELEKDKPWKKSVL